MKLRVREVNARSVLSKSGIPGCRYCVNPYTGCAHACEYCYATFMKRFTGHTEAWGSFVDVKVNAPEVLRRQLRRAERGSIIMSSVTDAYQPLEAKYKITRRCLEVIELFRFPVDILTKSPLVLRDVDIISRMKDAQVGITITTDDDSIRKIFEPHAPSVHARIKALKELHEAGIGTYVFIGPVLPMDPENLAKLISPFADSFIIDRMNYPGKTVHIYRERGIQKWLDERFIEDIIRRLKKDMAEKDVSVC